MRVTMVNKYYYPHLGGIEYHMRDLARGLHAAGVDVRILVANEGSSTSEDTIDDIPVTRLARAFAYASTPVAPAMPGAIRALGRKHGADGPAVTDIVHLHTPYPYGETAWLLGRPKGVPAVLTYHSDIVRQRFLGAAYRPLLERVLDAVDLIIASSPNMVEHSPLLAPRAEKCRVVPFGMDVRHYAGTPESHARAAELRALHERPVVLFVGRLVYYKGVDVLVRAMAKVDADLVIIGAGPLESMLREIAVADGTIDRITFLPPQPGDELIAHYDAADVFALPSVARSEAFGLVQIEAHAAGTPVVSTDLTTGVPFANQHGVTGYTVPVGDVGALAAALQELVTDDALRERLGRQAQERALSDFTLERMVADTIAVYREAMGGPRAVSAFPFAGGAA